MSILTYLEEVSVSGTQLLRQRLRGAPDEGISRIFATFAGLERGGVMSDEIGELRDAVRRFAQERDWDQFHSPKNLASALAVEAAELLENFQWLTEAQSASLSAEQKARVADEMADVLIYLIRIADKLDVNLLAAARDKLVRNAQKYPVDKARGNAKKYTEL
jgi:NTP pyrophosphatase (non-canonical NTP hydrolase)